MISTVTAYNNLITCNLIADAKRLNLDEKTYEHLMILEGERTVEKTAGKVVARVVNASLEQRQIGVQTRSMEIISGYQPPRPVIFVTSTTVP